MLPLDIISSLVNFGALTAFIVLHITVMNHYVIRGNHRSFKDILIYVVLPVIGLIIIGFVWWGLAAEAKTKRKR